MKIGIGIVLVFVLGGTSARAQQPAFTLQRDILVDSAGYQRLDLDATILVGGVPFKVDARTATNGLSDLRLYGSDGKEVPYLLVLPRRGDDQRVSARPLPITPSKRTSGFEVDLGAARTVDLLQVLGLPAPFLKRVRLDGSGDRVHWMLLVGEGTLFDLPREQLKLLELGFTAGDYRYLRLTWDDSTSGTMPLPSSVRVRYIPSTVVRPAEPLLVSLAFTRRPSEPGKSRYIVRLPGARLPIVALRLTVSDSNVMRMSRVTEARLSGNDVTPFTIGGTFLRRTARDGAVASQLEIPIQPPVESRLELVVDDGDNPPLSLSAVTGVAAELPFIFFQAAAAGTISARYGVPPLTAPRYDLEALRDSVAALDLVAARWGDTARLQPAAASTGNGIPTGGAPIEVSSFRWTRGILDSTPGLAVLHLDAAVLAHSRLTDIRIADPVGKQVPYLFEHLDGPLTDSLPPLEPLPRADTTARERALSRYRVRLPFDSLGGARLVLRTSSRVFRRRVRIEAPAPNDPRRAGNGPITVSSADWLHADADSPAPALTLAIPPATRDDLQVVVEEGDNEPLPLERPVLLLPGYELRFLSDGASRMRLLYGRRDIGAPTYDIALLGPRLVGVPANEAGLEPEGAPVARATNAMPGRIFWGVLITAVLVLLVIIARLVTQGAPPEGKAG